jgi:hypothetical protein
MDWKLSAVSTYFTTYTPCSFVLRFPFISTKPHGLATGVAAAGMVRRFFSQLLPHDWSGGC